MVIQGIFLKALLLKTITKYFLHLRHEKRDILIK